MEFIDASYSAGPVVDTTVLDMMLAQELDGSDESSALAAAMALSAAEAHEARQQGAAPVAGGAGRAEMRDGASPSPGSGAAGSPSDHFDAKSDSDDFDGGAAVGAGARRGRVVVAIDDLPGPKTAWRGGRPGESVGGDSPTSVDQVSLLLRPTDAVGIERIRQVDDVRELVLSFLVADDIARLGCTSSSWNSDIDSPELWRALFLRDFVPSAREAPVLRSMPAREAYAQRRRGFHRRVAAAHAAKMVERRMAVVSKWRRRLTRAMRGYHFALTMGCPLLLLIVISMVLPLRMDGDINWPYALVLTPLWVLYAIWGGGMAMTLCAAHRRNAAEDSVWHGQWAAERSLSKIVLKLVADGGSWAGTHMCAFCCSLALVPVMVVVKLDGVTDMPWAAAMWPLWLVFCCLPVFIRATRGHIDAIWTFVIALVVLGVPFLAVAVLAVASLDVGDIPLHVVLIPIWVLNGCALIAGVVACCIAAVQEFAARRHWQVVGGCLLIFLVVVPLPIFEALAAAVADGGLDASWSDVFMPLFLFLVVAEAVACALCVSAWRIVIQRERAAAA